MLVFVLSFSGHLLKKRVLQNGVTSKPDDLRHQEGEV